MSDTDLTIKELMRQAYEAGQNSVFSSDEDTTFQAWWKKRLGENKG